MDLSNLSEHYLKVICLSDDYNSPYPVGNPELLYPPFRDLIDELISKYNEVNTDDDCPYLYETFRSHALQNIYYYRGASKIRGGNILSAGMHHLGLAVDIINLEDNNGNKIKDKGESVDWTNINYITMRSISRPLGIYDLGGYEVCHFQGVPVSEQANVRREIYNGVINFQKENGLQPDGIVGKHTISKLKELYG